LVSEDDGEMLFAVYIVVVEMQEHLLPRGRGDAGADYTFYVRELLDKVGARGCGLVEGGIYGNATRIALQCGSASARCCWWCKCGGDERWRLLCMLVGIIGDASRVLFGVLPKA